MFGFGSIVGFFKYNDQSQSFCRSYPLWIYVKGHMVRTFDLNLSQSNLVVLGWIISLCVEPGIEPATFRFQSKALVTPLPSLRSSSTVP